MKLNAYLLGIQAFSGSTSYSRFFTVLRDYFLPNSAARVQTIF
jgi:hypothetical protein